MRKTTAAIGSILFFIVAPGFVTAVIPWWISGWRTSYPPAAMRYPWPVYVAQGIGVILIVAGAVVLISAFVRFAGEGIGTPAPIAPPERLVVGGFYRYVRNPMYLAVLSIIIGQALLFGSTALLTYAAAVYVGARLFVWLYEEPTLGRRYGAQYDAYRRSVPGWWPRLRPGRPEG